MHTNFNWTCLQKDMINCQKNSEKKIEQLRIIQNVSYLKCKHTSTITQSRDVSNHCCYIQIDSIAIKIKENRLSGSIKFN